MIHLHPGWLGSRLNIIVINIFVKVYGENEWGILSDTRKPLPLLRSMEENHHNINVISNCLTPPLLPAASRGRSGLQ